MRPTSSGIEHHVVELEIAVDDRGRRRDRPADARAARRPARPSPAASSSAIAASARSSRAPGARRSRPACRGRSSRCAATSMACRSASVSISASLTRRRAVGVGERRRLLGADDESAPPLHRVEHRADDRGSSHSRYGRGASGKTRCIADSQRNSRAMSCAVGGTGPSGGRRTTMSMSPKRDEIGQVRVAAGKLRDLAVRATRPGPESGTPADARAARRRARPNRAARPARDHRAWRISCSHGQHGRPTLSCAPCISTISAKVAATFSSRARRVHGRARLSERGDVPSPDRGRRSLAADGRSSRS